MNELSNSIVPDKLIENSGERVIEQENSKLLDSEKKNAPPLTL